jgi:hypothetical protein
MKYKKCGMLNTVDHQRFMTQNPNTAATAGATATAAGGMSAATAMPPDLHDADPSVNGVDTGAIDGGGSVDGGSGS